MLVEIITNPFLLMFFCILCGNLIGKVKYKNIKLGSSGVLFTGIIISYLIIIYLQKLNLDSQITQGQFVPTIIFQLSLIGFISSVGLLASKNISTIIKKYGYRFLILAFSITLTGASSTYFFINFIFTDLKVSLIGTYVGALTSSPGLATAMEIAKEIGKDAQSLVGLGYSISYIPGVIIVIIFVQLMSKHYKNIEATPITSNIENKYKVEEYEFCIISFSLVCIVGILLGRIKVYLGSHMGHFSLETTGGVLISALILGNLKKISIFKFNMNKKQLGIIRDISLNIFLSIVGLNYGYNAINLIRTSGAQLLLVGTITAILSCLIGLIVGTKLLKLPVVYLIGGICGGMTSTPGLAASIDEIESDEVTAGYGATYPFALLFMILFTSILFNLF